MKFLDIYFGSATKLQTKEKTVNAFMNVYLESKGRGLSLHSGTIYNNPNPIWDQHVSLSTENDDDTLIIELWNQNDQTKEQTPLMNTLEFPLSSISPFIGIDFDCDIFYRGDKVGHLLFKVNEIALSSDSTAQKEPEASDSIIHIEHPEANNLIEDLQKENDSLKEENTKLKQKYDELFQKISQKVPHEDKIECTEEIEPIQDENIFIDQDDEEYHEVLKKLGE